MRNLDAHEIAAIFSLKVGKQRLGFEWLWRLLMEPRRLFVRYLTTNPKALYAMLRNSR